MSLLAAIAASSVADAGLFEDIYRGLDLLATPSGFPIGTAGDGTRINGSRTGRLRIVPSGIGPGYELQFDRRFGADSSGRLETIYLGGLGELTLQGAIQATLGYNGKEFRRGRADFNISNLGYDLASKIGAQDVEFFGTLNGSGSLDINPLGFYDLRMQIDNTNSQLLLDGLVVEDNQDTNFNVGPIVVQGNIFYDLALGLLTSFGVDTANLEGATPQSPIDRINDAIQQQLQASRVAGEGLEAELAPLLLETVFEQDGEAAQELLAELAANAEPVPSELDALPDATVVPEPGTLLLLALGGATVWYGRRR